MILLVINNHSVRDNVYGYTVYTLHVKTAMVV